MSELKERRSQPRELAHLVTTIEVDGKETGCGVSRDASGSGFLLLTHLDLQAGSKIVLRVFVPREEEPRRIAASVIRSERIPLPEGLVWDYRVAVALEDPSPDLQELVHGLVRR
ncbi:MAG TPA: PilZ domain-containing protein [Polyangiaceae bacterium]